MPFNRTISLHIIVIIAFAIVLNELLLAPFKLWLQQEQRSEMHQSATNLNSFILNELSEPIYISIGIATYISSNRGEIDSEPLDHWLESLFAHTRHTRNIGVAPDNVLQYLYPKALNQQALGLRYADIPDQWPMVQRIMQTGQSQLQGPINLVQGERGFAFRQPIFVDGRYWGLVSTIINLDSVNQSIAQHFSSSPHALSIYNQAGELFYSNTENAQPQRMQTLDSIRVEQRIPLPETYWQVVVEGPLNAQAIMIARLLGALTLITFMLFGYTLWHKTRRAQAERAQVQAHKAQFLAAVSHELKTPLTVIQGSLSLLQHPDIHPDKKQQALQAALKQQQRLSHLIYDLLDFNLALNKQLRIVSQPTPLIPLLNTMVERFTPRFEQANIRFRLEYQGGIQPVLITDPARLEQVLRHLLDNTLKFCRSGDTVEIALDVAELVTISLRDTGPGIPNTFTQPNLELFLQHDGSDSRQQGGTGLGLALCREIIALLDGEMHICASPAEGSLIRMTWPLRLLQPAEHKE
ncbi:MAG: ATP-binding protein [Firmicutes bacterium]|nr:ATP-binding protein [Gammaproteobacteria bacterium]MCL5050375.1 ATP-binding protein [Bacillota bacterium]